MAKNRRTREKRTHQSIWRPGQKKQIDVLPNEVLLQIFDFCADIRPCFGGDTAGIDAWQSLVHVCRRWRSLIYGSPRSLNLRLVCAHEKRTRDKLDIWPALPLIVAGYLMSSSNVDNFIAALEHSNRVRVVDLYLWSDFGGSTSPGGVVAAEKILAVMQVPFPELTKLQLTSDANTAPVIPDSFLGGSVPPRLRIFQLSGIPFPGSPKLLSSATHLVALMLSNIPYSGYISPEAIVALVSALSSLRTLWLKFRSLPDPESSIPPPLKRSILSALDEFCFEGTPEYLEELVTRIDAPQLNHMQITLFDQIDLDCPPLAQFIDRTPTLRARNNAHVQFGKWSSVTLIAQSRAVEIVTSCSNTERDRQLWSITQTCHFSLPPPCAVEHLYIESHLRWSGRVSGLHTIENTQWLELLRSFTMTKNLYITREFALCIAASLQELVGARTTEVLPNLQHISVERFKPSGPFEAKIEPFVAARQLLGHPITISEYGPRSWADAPRGWKWTKDPDT